MAHNVWEVDLVLLPQYVIAYIQEYCYKISPMVIRLFSMDGLNELLKENQPD